MIEMLPPRAAAAALVANLVFASFAVDAHAQWPQWGGPNRDFTVETTGLADRWPEDGPKKLWHRELGKGYSSIAVDDGVLYTMYREPEQNGNEYTIALDAATGKTLWKKGRPSPRRSDDRDYSGPNATPLIDGDRVYTVGYHAVLHCFDKKDGSILWQHDLPEEFGGEVPHWGYSWSPIQYGDTVIMAAGKPENSRRTGSSLIAFDKTSGDVVWKTQTFSIGHSSPILITFDNQDQLVIYTLAGLMGVAPTTGRRLWEWSSPRAGSSYVVVTPTWDGKDTLYVSSAGSDHHDGTAIKLTKPGKRIVPEVRWTSNKICMYGSTPVRIGKHLYGANNQALLGFDVIAGKRTWIERDFPSATCLHADGKLILLDQNGWLSLATATPESLTVHSRCQVAERDAFTPPTLVGRTLYVRDEKHIMALDIGK